MLYYKTDNTIYANRKQLRDKIGIYEYKRETKRGNVIFLADDFLSTATICSDKTSVHNDYDQKQEL